MFDDPGNGKNVTLFWIVRGVMKAGGGWNYSRPYSLRWTGRGFGIGGVEYYIVKTRYITEHWKVMGTGGKIY
jgi:hypothetical protein